MIRKLFDTSRLAAVCVALAMFAVAGPLRHAAHFESPHATPNATTAGMSSAPAERGHAHDDDDIAVALSILLHGHDSGHTDHDHSTPLMTAPVTALADRLRSKERIDEADRVGREPPSPKPPPRV